MASKLKYHKNYTEFGEPYQLVLPLSRLENTLFVSGKGRSGKVRTSGIWRCSENFWNGRPFML